MKKLQNIRLRDLIRRMLALDGRKAEECMDEYNWRMRHFFSPNVYREPPAFNPIHSDRAAFAPCRPVGSPAAKFGLASYLGRSAECYDVDTFLYGVQVFPGDARAKAVESTHNRFRAKVKV